MVFTSARPVPSSNLEQCKTEDVWFESWYHRSLQIGSNKDKEIWRVIMIETSKGILRNYDRQDTQPNTTPGKIWK